MVEVLKVENLWKSYGRQEVLKGISLGLSEGESKIIIGLSGTWKSTLLRCINLLVRPN